MKKKDLDDLTYRVIGAAIKVHKAMGPGLLEKIYHDCLVYELKKRDIDFTSNMSIPVYYDSIEMITDLRCDLFIEDCLVLELKSVESIKPIFEAQLLTYMKLLSAPKGILFNFNCVNLFYDGQKTYVNEFYQELDN